MSESAYIYRCTEKCPIGKQCFIIKVEDELKEPLTVIQKCPARKSDIKITIGLSRPP